MKPSDLWHVWLFGWKIREENEFQKLQNFWMAKVLMRLSTLFLKFWVFKPASCKIVFITWRSNALGQAIVLCPFTDLKLMVLWLHIRISIAYADEAHLACRYQRVWLLENRPIHGAYEYSRFLWSFGSATTTHVQVRITARLVTSYIWDKVRNYIIIKRVVENKRIYRNKWTASLGWSLFEYSKWEHLENRALKLSTGFLLNRVKLLMKISELSIVSFLEVFCDGGVTVLLNSSLMFRNSG